VGPGVELAVLRAVAPGDIISRSAEPPRAPVFHQSSNIPTTVFESHDPPPCKIVVVPRLLECIIAGIAGLGHRFCAGRNIGALLSPRVLSLFHNLSTDPSALDTPLPASLSILHPSIPRSCIPFFAGYPPLAPNGIRPRNNKSFSLRCLVRAPQRLAR
jgi:hypothetical protein